MFCPKCGRNCGEDQFCMACGTRIPREMRKPLEMEKAREQQPWSAGMPCPYCGGNEVVEGRCAYCGGKLAEGPAVPPTENEQVYEIPYGEYPAVRSAVTLRNSWFVVDATVVFKKHQTYIPYDKVTSVRFTHVPDYSAFALGFVAFRWEENKALPYLDTKRAADKTSVSLSVQNELMMYHLFYVIRTMAPKTANFFIEGFVDLRSVNDFIDRGEMDRLFQKHAPFREGAIADLCTRTGLGRDQAKQIIDRSFDARQKVIYDANPRSAVKDLDLLLEKRRQEEEEAARKREEEQEMQRLANEVANRIRVD